MKTLRYIKFFLTRTVGKHAKQAPRDMTPYSHNPGKRVPRARIPDFCDQAKVAANIHISWKAPFTLDVANSDPDIMYSVLVTNENNPTKEYKTTDTSYNFIDKYSNLHGVYKYTLKI